MRHSNDIEPEPGAWEGVQSGVRRAHRMRVALSSAAVVALVAAGIFVVPKLTNRAGGSGQPVAPVPSASQSPSPDATPTTLPAGWTPLRYDEQGYWLTVPDRWKTGWFEGHAEYRPKGLPGLAVGDDTFAVETFFSQGVAQPDGNAQTVTINGRSAKRWESSEPGGAHTVTYELTLDCYTYPGSSAATDCSPLSPLRVIVHASTAELWDQHGADGERVARSIHAADDPMTAATYRTFQGQATVPWDGKTWVVAQFMESRIFGDTARGDVYLTANAKKQYDAKEGGLDRYDPDSSRRMVTYEIVKREGVDASSDEFTVRITEQSLDGSKPPLTYTETLGVGPGGTDEERHRLTPALIRFAIRNNG